jgi:hypothetical protein
VKPRVPEAGRSKTELRRGQIVEQRSAEAATTEAEQEFLFAATGEQKKAEVTSRASDLLEDATEAED